MDITFSSELAQALSQHAQQRRVPVEQLVREAVAWYLRIDPALLDELHAWQEVRDEALALTDEQVG